MWKPWVNTGPDWNTLPDPGPRLTEASPSLWKAVSWVCLPPQRKVKLISFQKWNPILRQCERLWGVIRRGEDKLLAAATLCGSHRGGDGQQMSSRTNSVFTEKGSEKEESDGDLIPLPFACPTITGELGWVMDPNSPLNQSLLQQRATGNTSLPPGLEMYLLVDFRGGKSNNN